MSAVFKREFKAYMNNVYGYLFMGILLFFIGALVSFFNLLAAMPAIEYALFYGRYVLLVMIPVLCMRSMAEDRRNKTDMFYLSLPIKTSAVVAGKYLALLAVYAIPMAVMALYPLLLALFGTVNWGGSYTSLLFFFLIGAGMIAVCQFLSSLTDNLVVAAVLGIAVSAVLCFVPLLSSVLPDAPILSFIGLAVLAVLAAGICYLVTRSFDIAAIVAAVLIVPLSVCYILFAERFAGVLPAVLTFVSPFYHFEEISQYGVLNLSSLILLLSYPVFFVSLTVRSADKKRWA